MPEQGQLILLVEFSPLARLGDIPSLSASHLGATNPKIMGKNDDGSDDLSIVT